MWHIFIFKKSEENIMCPKFYVFSSYANLFQKTKPP